MSPPFSGPYALLHTEAYSCQWLGNGRPVESLGFEAGLGKGRMHMPDVMRPGVSSSARVAKDEHPPEDSG